MIKSAQRKRPFRFHLVPMTLGAGAYDFFHQYGADIDRKAALNDSALLEKARVAGAGLVSST